MNVSNIFPLSNKVQRCTQLKESADFWHKQSSMDWDWRCPQKRLTSCLNERISGPRKWHLRRVGELVYGCINWLSWNVVNAWVILFLHWHFLTSNHNFYVTQLALFENMNPILAWHFLFQMCRLARSVFAAPCQQLMRNKSNLKITINALQNVYFYLLFKIYCTFGTFYL